MGSIRSTLAAALALTLLLSGCATGWSSPATLRTGYETFDGALEVWPPRGSLAGDADAVARVTRAVESWRSPTDERVHVASSGTLWLGSIDGTRLAVVAGNVPGTGTSWLLQLTAEEAGFEVISAVEYTDPGYLVYSDVLPVQMPGGRRYLTSARVERLVGPDDGEIPVDDGLSAPVDVPECQAITLTVTLRATDSLGDKRSRQRVLDLGTAINELGYPLVRDASGAGARALDGLDTCALTGSAGPFGSMPRRGPSGKPAERLPLSWPLDQIAVRELADVRLGSRQKGRLEHLTWHSATGPMSAVVYRPADAPAMPSRAERAQALQLHVLEVDNQTYVTLLWRDGPDTRLALPSGVSIVLDQPGVAVAARTATGRQTYRLNTMYDSYERSLTDRDVKRAIGN